jgi:hypothetical protein
MEYVPVLSFFVSNEVIDTFTAYNLMFKTSIDIGFSSTPQLNVFSAVRTGHHFYGFKRMQPFTT